MLDPYKNKNGLTQSHYTGSATCGHDVYDVHLIPPFGEQRVGGGCEACRVLEHVLCSKLVQSKPRYLIRQKACGAGRQPFAGS